MYQQLRLKDYLSGRREICKLADLLHWLYLNPPLYRAVQHNPIFMIQAIKRGGGYNRFDQCQLCY